MYKDEYNKKAKCEGISKDISGEYNQISKTNKSKWLIEGGKNANKRNNIHICTYTDKDLSRGLRRIPITLCNKDKLLHLGNPQKHLSRIVNCIHFLDDGLCNLHKGFCENLKPKITSHKEHIALIEKTTPTNTLLTAKKVKEIIGMMATIKTDKDKLIIEIAFGDFDIALSGHGKTYAERLKKEILDMVD